MGRVWRLTYSRVREGLWQSADEAPKYRFFFLRSSECNHVCASFFEGHHDADVLILDCLGHGGPIDPYLIRVREGRLNKQRGGAPWG